MLSDLPLFPKQASSMAWQVDALYLFLVALSAVMSLLIAGLLLTFAVRYRAKSRADRSNAPEGNNTLEMIWTLIPLGIVMFIFTWGAGLYFHMARPPEDTMDVLVVGKRWMWKLQHLSGRREINELHVPVGRAVKLTMTSEDVIHSFFVPAFRVKMDVLPGRYSTVWFKPTRPGTYHLFCAEYCGTKHSQMIGSVVVMQPDDFQAWLGGDVSDLTPAQAGERLFNSLGCITCHNPGSGARGPALTGLFGRQVRLAGGSAATADEIYLRQSIEDPRAMQVEGFEPLMPTYRGMISEEGMLQIIEYIKTLGPGPSAGAAPSAAQPARGGGS